MKVVRIIAIVLVALTAIVNVVGGAGTYCAAFTPEKYDSMKALIPLQWLYQVLVFAVVGVGLAGAWSTFSLARAHKNSYRTALIILIVGIALAIVQMAASRSLRGKSMPTDLRLYVGGLTLIVFLLLRLPGVWQAAGMVNPADSGGGWQTPSGIASIVMGLAVLTVPLWVGNSHAFDGANWVYAWDRQLLLTGAALSLGGVASLINTRSRMITRLHAG
ncbi:MAG: hypothetical protein JW850_14035 [Thermoflexales bacterium]|nr:hypothetical protein [Thermoflexales bacterium]